jgi:hypothetical protein
MSTPNGDKGIVISTSDSGVVYIYPPGASCQLAQAIP